MRSAFSSHMFLGKLFLPREFIQEALLCIWFRTSSLTSIRGFCRLDVRVRHLDFGSMVFVWRRIHRGKSLISLNTLYQMVQMWRSRANSPDIHTGENMFRNLCLIAQTSLRKESSWTWDHPQPQFSDTTLDPISEDLWWEPVIFTSILIPVIPSGLLFEPPTHATV